MSTNYKKMDKLRESFRFKLLRLKEKVYSERTTDDVLRDGKRVIFSSAREVKGMPNYFVNDLLEFAQGMFFELDKTSYTLFDYCYMYKGELYTTQQRAVEFRKTTQELYDLGVEVHKLKGNFYWKKTSQEDKDRLWF